VAPYKSWVLDGGLLLRRFHRKDVLGLLPGVALVVVLPILLLPHQFSLFDSSSMSASDLAYFSTSDLAYFSTSEYNSANDLGGSLERCEAN